MKIEVGQYVRTKEGYICKILKLNEKYQDDGYLDFNDIHSPRILYKNIVKASHNIIDLIEVGDYVNDKKVSELMIKVRDEQGIFGLPSYGNVYVEEIPVKSIVTKEQFERASYKVGVNNVAIDKNKQSS